MLKTIYPIKGLNVAYSIFSKTNTKNIMNNIGFLKKNDTKPFLVYSDDYYHFLKCTGYPTVFSPQKNEKEMIYSDYSENNKDKNNRDIDFLSFSLVERGFCEMVYSKSPKAIGYSALFDFKPLIDRFDVKDNTMRLIDTFKMYKHYKMNREIKNISDFIKLWNVDPDLDINQVFFVENSVSFNELNKPELRKYIDLESYKLF